MEVTLSDGTINVLRTSLEVAIQAGVFQSVAADYAADKTLEYLDRSLSTYDKKKQENLLENVVTDGENMFLVKDPRSGTELWLQQTRMGPRFHVEVDGDKVSLGDYMVEEDVSYLEEYGKPNVQNSIEHVFEEGGRERHREVVEYLSTQPSKTTLYLLSFEDWTEEGAIDRDAINHMKGPLSQQGINQRPHTLLRKTLVEGNQETLLEDNQEE